LLNPNDIKRKKVRRRYPKKQYLVKLASGYLSSLHYPNLEKKKEKHAKGLEPR